VTIQSFVARSPGALRSAAGPRSANPWRPQSSAPARRPHPNEQLNATSRRPPSAPLPPTPRTESFTFRFINCTLLGALANAGRDTRSIQAYLGHRDIRHTVRYIGIEPALRTSSRADSRLLYSCVIDEWQEKHGMARKDITRTKTGNGAQHVAKSAKKS
jgi:hypothetical protein